MTDSTIIAPSILAADLGILEQEIAEVEEGKADWLHIDVMDGKFVPPITFGDNIVSAIKKRSKLFLDVHLMITEPEKQIESFAQAGADLITIHTETCNDIPKMIDKIHSLGVKAGVAINPGTTAKEIFPALDSCDLALVMTVNPGWGGQKFIEDCLGKIRAISEECTKRGVSPAIEVDGGVNVETGKKCKDAGATVLVAGSSIFGSPDRAQAIESLRAA